MAVDTALRRKPLHLVIALLCFAGPLLLLPVASAGARPEQWSRTRLGAGTTTSIASGGSPAVLYTVLARAGVWRSTDGVNWQPANGGLPTGALDDISVCGLAVDPRDAYIVYAGVEAGGDTSIYRTANGGGSWSAVATGLGSEQVCALAVAPRGDTVYAATGARLLAGVNQGSAWALQGGWSDEQPALAIAVARDDSAHVYVQTGQHIYASSDAGRTWQDITPASAAAGISTLAVTGQSGQLVVGVGDDLLGTSDGGATWAPVGRVPGTAGLRALLWDDADESVGFAASDSGVWRTVDGGATWLEMPGVAPAGVSGLAQAERGLLFAATGAGVWRSKIALPPPPTATATSTATHTATPSATATRTATATPTATATATVSATATATVTVTASPTQTSTPAATATPTLGPALPNETATPTLTPPAAPPTNTPQPPPPATATPEPTAPPTATPQPTSTPTRPIR